MRAVDGVAKTFKTIDTRRNDGQVVHQSKPADSLLYSIAFDRMRLNRGAGRMWS
jgi:hypothetical protein